MLTVVRGERCCMKGNVQDQ